MSIPEFINQLELKKFTESVSNPGKAPVMVVNPDGSNISASGAATIAIGSAPTLFAVVNTSAPGQASVVLDTGVRFIGLATVVIGSSPTLFAVVNTGAVGNTNSLATLLSGPNQIGSVTISNNPTLGTGANFIGLATVVQGNQPALVAGTAYIGLASVNIGGSLPIGTNYIGLASVNIGGTLPVGTNYIGLASVNIGGSLPIGANYIGLASVNIGGTLPPLATGTNFIGLATVIDVPFSTYTSLSTILSASGNATLLVPPNNQRWIAKDLLISSLGRNEVSILSGTKTLIPLTALSTTGGYVMNSNDSGFIKGNAVNDSLVVTLSGTATISVMVNVRFE